jgi:sugar phosphate isomerase/epimerase
MKLTVTSWSFPTLTLHEVAGVAQAIGIDAVDVGLFYRSSLDRARLLAEPEAYAAELRALSVQLSNLYWLFGGDLAERNLADPSGRAANGRDMAQVARFCAAAGIPSIMILPGVLGRGQSRGDALRESAAALRELLPIAQEAGVTLAIEPHVHSFVESPALAGELLAAAPGVGLVLDYAHFVCLGYRQEEIDALAPHAVHVHLRQARPGALQAKLAQGTINFAALLATLRAAGYSSYLAIEYVHQDYMNTLSDDVLTETVLMRDLVRAGEGG